MLPFQSLPSECIEWVADHTVETSFSQGETLIRQGSHDRDCFFITEGEVEVTRDGRVLGRTGAGNPEGELALLYRTPRSGTTQAITDVRTLRLKADDFDRLAEKSPEIAQAIADAIVDYLQNRFNVKAPRWTPAP